VLIGGASSKNTNGIKELIRGAKSLFIASRQLHEIAAPLFYRRTIFDFENIDYLGVFLNTIGASNRQNLRYVAIYLERGDALDNNNGSNGDDLTAAFLQAAITTLSSLPVTLRAIWVFTPVNEQFLAVDKETGTMHQPLRGTAEIPGC
jgi:hypothetical protein